MIDLAPAIAIIEEFEGLRLESYQDGAGNWTIGYGHTHGVHRGQIITLQQAQAFLTEDINESLSDVEQLTKVSLNNNELCALISFVFNVGGGNYAGSTLLKLLNRGASRAQVADQFLRWVHDSEGNVEPGLYRRRRAERELFLTAELKLDEGRVA